MSSNVGSSGVYEAGDQRNPPDSEKDNATRHEEGKDNSHKLNDPSKSTSYLFVSFTMLRVSTNETSIEDEKSIKNRLDAAEDQNDDNTGSSGKKLTVEDKLAQEDPTAPAKLHGNEPSRGAKIDAQILDEEEEILRRKDESEAAKKANKKKH